MTLNTFTSGVNTSFSTELNENFNSYKIAQIYTGSGFDLSVSGASTSTTELAFTDFSASTLAGADYLIIEITADNGATRDGGDAGGAACYYQIQSAESGGTYADSLAETLVHELDTAAAGSGDDARSKTLKTFKWVHTLSAGEKTNGVDIKIKTKVVSDTASTSGSITNKQTVFTLGA